MTDFQEWEWFGRLGVGTPPQWFKVAYDLGSANAWVAVDAANATFRPKASSSFKALPAEDEEGMRIPYGSGTVKGMWAEERLHVGGASFRATLGVVGGVHARFDGLVGIGDADLAIDHLPPPLSQLPRKHGPVHTYSLYLRPPHGALVLGEPEASYADGAIRYVPLAKLHKNTPYWMVTGTDIQAGGDRLALCPSYGGCTLVLDLGTAQITGPPVKVKQLLARIGPVAEDCSNARDKPELSFTIGGWEYTLGQEHYVRRPVMRWDAPSAHFRCRA